MFHGWFFKKDNYVLIYNRNKAKGLVREHSLEECARLLPCKFAYVRPLSPVSIRRKWAIEIYGLPGLHFGGGLLAFMLPAVYRPLWMMGPIGGTWGQLRFDLWSCDRSLWGVYWSANLLLSFISAQCFWLLLKIPKYLIRNVPQGRHGDLGSWTIASLALLWSQSLCLRLICIWDAFQMKLVSGTVV